MKQNLLLLAFFVVGFLLLDAQDNIVHTGNNVKTSGFEFGITKKYTHEVDLYISNGWGVGYQLRREFNPYVGWNVFGISYLSEFCNPSDTGMIYLRVAGIRGHTPAAKWFRGYLDITMAGEKNSAWKSAKDFR